MTELVNVISQPFTGAAAIAETLAPDRLFRLLRIEVHWSAAPTTSEDFTVKLDAGDGSAYDVLIDSVNPSAGSQTDLIFTYGEGYEYEADDEIDIAYPNTDTKTISGKIVYELPK